MSVAVILEPAHLGIEAEFDAGRFQMRRDDGPEMGAENARQRRVEAVDQRHRTVAGPGRMCDLATDEAAADDDDAPGPRDQRVAQLLGIVPVAQRVDTVERPLARVRPRPRPRARGDQQPVVGQGGAVREMHLSSRAIERGRGHAEAPFRVEIVGARKRAGAESEIAGQDLLREGRPIVGRIRLSTDDGEPASEARPPRRLRARQAGQRGTDDDEMRLADAHRRSTPSLTTRIALTGQATRARSTSTAVSAGGDGS